MSRLPDPARAPVATGARFGEDADVLVDRFLTGASIEEQLAACEALRRLGRGRAVPALLRRLDGATVGARHALLCEVALLGGKRAFRALADALRDRDPAVRETAAYGLRVVSDERSTGLLLERLRDAAENPRVRGQAAEGLSYLPGRRRRERAAIVRALTDALAEPAPEVRFWAAFALGSLGARSARAALRRVAETDEAVCPGWWRVADEAADALVLIAGGSPPERRPAGAAAGA